MESTRAWVDRMHAIGRLVFTTDQARADLGVTASAAWNALSRAQTQGLIFSPAKSLYVVVPAEYRTAGAPPWLAAGPGRWLRRRSGRAPTGYRAAAAG